MRKIETKTNRDGDAVLAENGNAKVFVDKTQAANVAERLTREGVKATTLKSMYSQVWFVKIIGA